MMMLRKAATILMVTSTALAVYAAPAGARNPAFTASPATSYAEFRALTESAVGERLDPQTPGQAVAFGGEVAYPLTDSQWRALIDGRALPGVDRLATFDRIGDSVTFGQMQASVLSRIGRMIRGIVFTVVRPEKNYHVFCWTDGKEVLCEVWTPIEI
jgi:hypothetical protein